MSVISQNEDTSSSVNKSEDTYTIVVLQSLMALKSIKRDLLFDVSTPKKNTPLTNNFKNIIYGLFNLPNNIFYQELMKTYDLLAKSNNNSEAFMHDPFHFLKYLLEYLNNENITILEPSFFQLYPNAKKQYQYNMQFTFEYFKQYCSQTQISIISKNIHYSQIEQINCFNCNTYYDCSLKSVLEIDLDKYINSKKNSYPQIGDVNISLNECLFYYFNSNETIKCLNCNNYNANIYKKLINSSNALIIYLNRKVHKGEKDINIDFNINLSNYFNKNLVDRGYINYSLKSCIGFNAKENRYVTDYCFYKNENNLVWYRFSKDYKQIQTNEIINFKPILLFYETTDEKKIKFNNMNINMYGFQSFQNINQINPIYPMYPMYQINQNNEIPSQAPSNINSFSDSNQIEIIFKIVSEENPDKEEGLITMQKYKTEKISDIIQSFFIKLQKDESVIKKFIFNNEELSKTSNQTASEINLYDKCIIQAIKDQSFDDNSNNNNIENNNNNINSSNNNNIDNNNNNNFNNNNSDNNNDNDNNNNSDNNNINSNNNNNNSDNNNNNEINNDSNNSINEMSDNHEEDEEE